MGGAYINDFNQFGRTWQVKVQAEAQERMTLDDVFNVRVRSAKGDLIPLRAFADAKLVSAPASILRYNNLRSVTLQGGPSPGHSSGEAIAAMEELSATTLPSGYSFEWTGTALQEKAAGGQTSQILVLGADLRLPVPGRAVRELDDPRRGADLHCRRLCRARSPRC